VESYNLKGTGLFGYVENVLMYTAGSETERVRRDRHCDKGGEVEVCTVPISNLENMLRDRGGEQREQRCDYSVLTVARQNVERDRSDKRRDEIVFAGATVASQSITQFAHFLLSVHQIAGVSSKSHETQAYRQILTNRHARSIPSREKKI
jgi:hypothetical protein